jgi:hypothetical protein
VTLPVGIQRRHLTLRFISVKWQSLPYEDATWELEKDVDNELIERWSINQTLPPENERAVSINLSINQSIRYYHLTETSVRINLVNQPTNQSINQSYNTEVQINQSINHTI